jgi:acetyl esterase/lipase
MGRHHQRNFIAAAAAALFLLAGACGASAGQPKPLKIDLKIAGGADDQLLDRISFCLMEEARKMPPTDREQIAAELQKNPPEIVMDQFRKTALDIPYADKGTQAQRLDIVYPFAGEAPYKVIVNFHGGGWEAGNKRSAGSAAVLWATYQGYAVVNAGYRLSGEAKWPAQIHDAKAAIRFIRANAKKFELDADKIVVWGLSAGGHLAQMLGATNNNRKMEDLSMGNPKTSSAVQGVVSWYGVSEITSLSRLSGPFADKLMGYCIQCKMEKSWTASPIEFVNKNFPPILLVHGTNDQVVPFMQSIKMAKKVNIAAGREQARVRIFINASHGDAAIKTAENVADNLDFVDGILFPGGKNPHRSLRYELIQISK